MSAADDIKQRIDIVDLVAQYTTLKRAGRGYVGLCPFHQERTGSFHVDPARQTWHCFGACGTGGDIFNFIMKKEGCEFRDALRTLADRAGVTLESHRDMEQDSRRARLYELNEAAATFFAAALGGETPGAQVARGYVEERHVASDSVGRFQLGYAPNSWEALVEHLSGRSFTAEEVVGAGLAVEGERGAYDRFRHRLMYTIRDDRGRVAGFGGRLLPGEALGSRPSDGAQPKYVNTSQSSIFDKGAILYGLHLAKDAIRSEGRALIVEGYMDVIAAHEHGYANVVASMGTALTERQVALLKRHTTTIVLALDADNAGSEATIRSAYEIVNNSLRRRPVPNARGVVRQVEALDLDLRVLSLPEGRDPDEVIRSEPDGWPALIETAKPVVDHLLAVASGRHDLDDARERSAVVREVAPFIALTADRVLQSHYLQQLSRLVRVDEGTLRAELRAPVRGRERAPETAAPGLPMRTAPARREQFLLALLFQYPELRADAEELEAEIFNDGEHRALFNAWRDLAGSDITAASFVPELRSRYEEIAELRVPVYDGEALVRALQSTVWGIEQERLRLAKRAKSAVLNDIAAADGDAIAERARSAWAARGDHAWLAADADADPADAFVDDTEAGLKVHQRLLAQRHGTRPARRGGE